MRLPRVRFGVAGLMLVVGLAGAGMGLWQMGRRADSFRARADLYLRLEASSSRLIGACAHTLDQYRDLIVEARRTGHVDLIRSIRAEAAIVEEDLKLARGHLAYRARLRRK